MTRSTILLADNDLDFLRIAQEFLEKHGYHVLSVADIAEARRILAHEPIALAILDFRLANDDDDHDKSGLHLARDVSWASSVPRIVMTRFDRYEYARDALRPVAGGKSPVVDFITKQEGLEALLASIQHSLVETRIFLCYARPDEIHVSRLYDSLCSAGFTPWMDKKCITGGENWASAIRRAIRESDFFVICISSKSVNRRGFMQKEINMALQVLDEMLEDDIYLIPARLEDCSITSGRLQSIQWVDVFGQDGFQKLAQAIRVGMKRRS